MAQRQIGKVARRRKSTEAWSRGRMKTQIRKTREGENCGAAELRSSEVVEVWNRGGRSPDCLYNVDGLYGVDSVDGTDGADAFDCEYGSSGADGCYEVLDVDSGNSADDTGAPGDANGVDILNGAKSVASSEGRGRRRRR